MGFTWWADRHAQTIEVVGCERNEEGEQAYWVSVQTDFLRNFEMTDKALSVINPLLMGCASMAGPVFDEHKRTISLCSLVRVHDSIREWMSRLISVASVLQIAEARIIAPELATYLGADSAESGHPVNGMRPIPDEFAGVVATLIAPLGQESCKWHPMQFEQAVCDYLEPAGLPVTWGFRRLAAKLPCGDKTSLFDISGNDPHPRYGNGLLLNQSFPLGDLSELRAIRLAWSLNADTLVEAPVGYGFGSFCAFEGELHFTTFLPNVVERHALVLNFCSSATERAEYMSRRLLKGDK